jgi:hypothetical protein
MEKSEQNSIYKTFTTVVIIIIVFLLFVLPALRKIINKPDLRPWQKNQFKTISISIEFFNSEWGKYPPSSSLEENGKPYCGAMKLCEAMLGQDLLGFNPDSVFNRDGTDNTGKQLYDITTQGSREELFLTLERANVYRLEDIYGSDVGSFLPFNYVLCDVYTRKVKTGQKVGMPILYYKADTSKTAHDVNNPDNPDNIYNYKDNHAFLALGTPDKQNKKHPLFENPKLFYKITKNYKITSQSKPHRPDSFILLSAGKDGLYGTWDDIANFDWKWNF